MTLTLSKGLFRYASGRMSKNAYRVVAPTATISIRGTEFVATAVTVVAGQSVALGPTSAAPVIGLASPPTDPALAKSFNDADGEEFAVEIVGEDR